MLPILVSLSLLTNDEFKIYQDLDEAGEYSLTTQNELLYKVKEEKCEKANKNISKNID